MCVGGHYTGVDVHGGQSLASKGRGNKSPACSLSPGHVSFLFYWRKRLTLISAEYTHDFVFSLYNLEHLCAMTTDSSVTPPNEREKPTAVDVENVNSEKVAPTATVDAERSALLASLPDPDAGKTDEERREIVS